MEVFKEAPNDQTTDRLFDFSLLNPRQPQTQVRENKTKIFLFVLSVIEVFFLFILLPYVGFI